MGGWEKKQCEGKLCSPQALSEKTDAPELGVYVLQVSTAKQSLWQRASAGNAVFVR